MRRPGITRLAMAAAIVAAAIAGAGAGNGGAPIGPASVGASPGVTIRIDSTFNDLEKVVNGVESKLKAGDILVECNVIKADTFWGATAKWTRLDVPGQRGSFTQFGLGIEQQVHINSTTAGGSSGSLAANAAVLDEISPAGGRIELARVAGLATDPLDFAVVTSPIASGGADVSGTNNASQFVAMVTPDSTGFKNRPESEVSTLTKRPDHSLIEVPAGKNFSYNESGPDTFVSVAVFTDSFLDHIGLAGGQIVIPFTVVNAGNTTDSFSLSATNPRGWAMSISDLYTGALAPGQLFEYRVTLQVPVDTSDPIAMEPSANTVVSEAQSTSYPTTRDSDRAVVQVSCRPVGGLAELPQVGGSSGANYALLAGGLAAAALALTAGGWYARRRWLR